MQSTKLFKLAIGVAALSGALLGSNARAAVWTVNTTGTIESGFDTSGVFGTAGASLSGQAYSMSIIVDPDLYSNQSGNSLQVSGEGSLSGLAMEVVTVNGITQSYVFDLNLYNQGQSYLYASAAFTQAYQYQSGTTTTGYSLNGEQTLFAYDNPLFGNVASTRAFSYRALPADVGYASFNLYGNGVNTYFSTSKVDTLSIKPAGDVPEPAPLSMLILALVALGVGQRRARQSRIHN